MKKQTEEYIVNLREAIYWAISPERAAWQRTVAEIRDSEGYYRIEDLEAARSGLIGKVDEYLMTWLNEIYALETDRSLLAVLQTPPEELWKLMVCLNAGIFAKENVGDPLINFLVTIPSIVPGVGPLYLSPNMDGWGVKPHG